MAATDEVERWHRLNGYMGKLPPARARYSEEEEIAAEGKLAAAIARRWTIEWVQPKGSSLNAGRTEKRPIRRTAFVPILEAANQCRDERGQDGFNAFWDALAQSALDGEFDGTERLHVVDNQPVIRMRFRSEHMRLLTAEMYTRDDVVLKRLARCWLSQTSAFDWCERHGFSVPSRWRRAAHEKRKGPGRPRKKDTCVAEFERREKSGIALASDVAEANHLVTWAESKELPSIPKAETLRKTIGELRAKK